MLSVLAPLCVTALAALSTTSARAEEVDEQPQLQMSKPIRCMRGPEGRPVRVQCEPEGGGQRCLVAPATNAYTGEMLEGLGMCTSEEGPEAYAALAASGARLVPALADALPGYARSDTGRAFQVKFDLMNRLYIGASWVPTFQIRDRGTGPTFGPFARGSAEAGIHLSILSPHARARHELRILEGSATFDDLELNGVVFSYDYQHRHRRPAFWLSTFIGPPAVFPVAARTGWGFRIFSVNDRPPAFRNALDMEFGELHLSWHPWQSRDMYSFLRLEAGGDFGHYWQNRAEASEGLDTGQWYAGPTAAVRSRFSLGEGGLHMITTEMTYRRPTAMNGVHGAPSGAAINRLDALLAYEGVLLAINDQPLSVRLTAGGNTRNDLVEDLRSVELRLSAGLRMSFWAPPRVFEPMPELEDP
ncbi:Hypothetical protein CAP_3766 [Chondromyces apiculatus DSM 436]|uniref:Uncharacterized protein n=2 Tax=Chondromyces apiculatus TaxID=51 RepID=A0A017T822_9BACT|nr:Hypothetical protein CAP_3766 [Chondromyces apiculatus DSM 436]